MPPVAQPLAMFLCASEQLMHQLALTMGSVQNSFTKVDDNEHFWDALAYRSSCCTIVLLASNMSLRIQMIQPHCDFTSNLPPFRMSMKCKINFFQEQNFSEMRQKETQLRSLSFLIITHFLHLSSAETFAKLVEVCSEDIGWLIEIWHTNKKPQMRSKCIGCVQIKYVYTSHRNRCI